MQRQRGAAEVQETGGLSRDMLCVSLKRQVDYRTPLPTTSLPPGDDLPPVRHHREVRAWREPLSGI